MFDKGISLLGLVAIMGIAYLFSSNRNAVNFRTILWGVCLQLLFAVIILSEQLYSFVGMFVLMCLVLLYMFESEIQESALGRWGGGAVAVIAAAALVYLGHLLHGVGVTPVVVGLAVVVAVVGGRMGRRTLLRSGGVGILTFGLATLWARGIDGRQVFAGLSARVAEFLGLANEGAEFMFGNLVHSEHFFPGSEIWPGFGFQFAFSVLPTIIFFSAFMAVMYHLGVVQVVILAMARFMRWSMGTSGPETVSCSANIFVGQTEAPFLVKPFLKEMTPSELNAVMIGGFATIAGGVLAGFIQMGVNPGHLIAASVMSAPAALVIAKLMVPETDSSKTQGEVTMPEIQKADNVVGAAANGVTDGLKLALNVGAMLIAFIALIAFVDKVLLFFDGVIDGRLLGGAALASGEVAGIFPGSVKTFFGTVLRPLAFLMGVPWADAGVVGNLLGTKLAINEFVAFGFLGEHIANGDMSERAEIISTYALCGFANFSSIGIQIGGLGALAPERRSDLAKLGMRAMFGGALASWMTATVAGVLL